MPAIIITITHGSQSDVYEDRVLKNIYTGDYEVYYSGQNFGMLDHQLIHGIQQQYVFRVYHRVKTGSFIFLGESSEVSIVQERQVPMGMSSYRNERLQLKIVVRNAKNEHVPLLHSSGHYKYKQSVFIHNGMEMTGNPALGFFIKE